MDDLIRRQDALDALKQQAEEMSRWSERYAEQRKGVLTAINVVSDLPSAQPKTGTWIDCGWAIACSECNYDMPWAVRNYCPNCGARMLMEGEEHESC